MIGEHAKSAVSNGARDRLHMRDVGPRDGLQIGSVFVPAEDKIAMVHALSRTGLAKIEMTSFVSPKAIPALRDADEVMRGIEPVPGVEYAVLVPNVRGAERAIDAQADELNLVMSATETPNLANLRMTREQSFAALATVASLGHGTRIPAHISLSCTFGCPMEGDVQVEVVLDRCARLARRSGRPGARPGSADSSDTSDEFDDVIAVAAPCPHAVVLPGPPGGPPHRRRRAAPRPEDPAHWRPREVRCAGRVSAGSGGVRRRTARRRAVASWHCLARLGTCKMGPATRPPAVVDTELRVPWLQGLRVVVASVMPTMLSGNTGAPAMMVAEKVADMILGRTPPSAEHPRPR